jgi:hypothetical protein
MNPDDARRLQIIKDEVEEALSRGGSKWYILDASGNPVRAPSLIAWCKWFGRTMADDGQYLRLLARDEIGNVTISTVFLGIDHGWGSGPPILWETMIFHGPLDQTQERYTSRADALAGHARWVNAVEETQDAPP